ncbi:MAG: SWIM zinc finger family protein [Methanoregulaceae archaeon]|nr:SWIM zinc finger family protein [Methanoregulaceae archaeon]
MDIDDLVSSLKSEQTLSSPIREEIVRLFGDRGKKALKAIDESRIKKYRDFFVVVGTSDEYIVDDEFCTCPDFSYRGGHCWHVLAVRIASLTGDYEEIDLWYQDSWCDESPADKQYLS